MKKNAILIFLGLFWTQLKAENYPPFELWNKTKKSIWFAVANTEDMSDDKVMSEPLIELPAGKYAIAKDTLVNKSNFTRLLITQKPDEKSVTVYTFNPNKHIWVRVKEGKDKLVFGPQTGPLVGLMGHTENGYPLDQNVNNNDYKVENHARSKEQEGMMLLKSAFRSPSHSPLSKDVKIARKPLNFRAYFGYYEGRRIMY